MGRGRKPRVAATIASTSISLMSTSGLQNDSPSKGRNINTMQTTHRTDDHSYASPKKKENKLEPSKNMILKTVLAKEMNVENRRTNMNLRRNRAINSYFSSVSSSPSNTSLLTGVKTKESNVIDLTGGDAAAGGSAHIETSLVTNNNFLSHPKLFGSTNFIEMLSTESCSTTRNETTNIFLQEPVLTLNVDKSETCTSPTSVLIRKSFIDVTPPGFGQQYLMRTEPSHYNHQSQFNGENDKLSSDDDGDEETESNKMPLDLSKPTQLDHIDSTTTTSALTLGSPPTTTISDKVTSAHTAAFLINENSNNSCDSGVVVEKPTDLLLDGSHIRKPITPHRILCPSPVKHIIPSHHHPYHPSLNVNGEKRNIKSKKRLSINDECSENIPKNQISTTAIVVDEDDDDVDDSEVLAAEPKDVKRNENAVDVKRASEKKTNGNKTLTEYFQVRRSVRKTKKEVQEEKERYIEKAVVEGLEDGLKVRIFSHKGRGIVTTRTFTRGEFVIEYVGDLISYAEAQRREQMYAEDLNTGCYMYYFRHNNQQYCIDATAESGRLGRLVNHSRNGNLMTKTMVIRNKPRLLLFANKEIPPGTEITYDYGDRSKESLANHPWLAQ